jgi:V/A-type H+-transporting ATPase subunit G/H
LAAVNTQTFPTQAELLEKIRQAELEANQRLEQAKARAQAMINDAKVKADAIIREAEEAARRERDRILSENMTSVEKELVKIRSEAEKNIQSLKNRSPDPQSIRHLVLSVLEE